MMENGYEAAKTGPDDSEVQKLKVLVKKLEKQNEHLRNRTGRLSASASKFSKPNGSTGEGGFSDGATSDDLKVLDRDDVISLEQNEDEGSWLFTSPVIKSKSFSVTSDVKQSPEDWLSEEMRNPSTPQLMSAKRNIMYKLNGSFDGSPLDISYLQKSIEKSLSMAASDYPLEDATDVQVAARLQQDELRKGSPLLQQNFTESPTNHKNKHGSVEDETEWNSSSSGSPHHVHHLPVPSQTMTTVHGLIPSACVDEEDTNSLRRPRTPTRMDRNPQKYPDKRGSSPRARSPAQIPAGKTLVRRSLPSPSTRSSSSTNRVNSVANSLPGELNSTQKKSPADRSQTHQPLIKSSLTAPASRLSKINPRSSLPSPGGRSIPAPRSKSPMTSLTSGIARRSLPRPSQTSTSMKYVPSQKSPPNPPKPDIWGDDDEVY